MKKQDVGQTKVIPLEKIKLGYLLYPIPQHKCQ